jgi:hypothetical protein
MHQILSMKNEIDIYDKIIELKNSQLDPLKPSVRSPIKKNYPTFTISLSKI